MFVTPGHRDDLPLRFGRVDYFLAAESVERRGEQKRSVTIARECRGANA